MWPHEKLKILVPRTPPDTPLPPLTPPRGPGGPKMAKMHSLKSIDDNLCQKSHFWGVKKIDLFFHSEYTMVNFLVIDSMRTLTPSWDNRPAQISQFLYLTLPRHEHNLALRYNCFCILTIPHVGILFDI